MQASHPLGAILAGGASSRMGRDKAAVEVAGAPMLDWVVRALRHLTDDIVVVGRDQAGEIEAIADREPGRLGPLAGLDAALRHAPGREVLLVAVDQPFVRHETLARLTAYPGGDAVVPLSEGFHQTTCALYRPGVAEAAAEALRSGGSLRSVLEAVDTVVIGPDEWRSWGEDGRSWFSVDTPQAIGRGLRRFGPPAAE